MSGYEQGHWRGFLPRTINNCSWGRELIGDFCTTLRSDPGSKSCWGVHWNISREVLSTFIHFSLSGSVPLISTSTLPSSYTATSLAVSLYYWHTMFQIDMTNYVPICSWFFGPMSRDETNDMLTEQSEGVFLVRESQTLKGDFVLCVKWVVSL